MLTRRHPGLASVSFVAVVAALAGCDTSETRSGPLPATEPTQWAGTGGARFSEGEVNDTSARSGKCIEMDELFCGTDRFYRHPMQTIKPGPNGQGPFLDEHYDVDGNSLVLGHGMS